MACIFRCSNGADDTVDQATGLSGRDVKAVTQTWNAVNKQWAKKNGYAFFNRLFTNQPRTKTFFKSFHNLSSEELANSSELKAHVITFGNSVTSLVENLKQADIVVSMLHKLTESHVIRGINIDDFKVALEELVGFLDATLRLTDQQKEAWSKVAKVIISVVDNHAKELTS